MRIFLFVENFILSSQEWCNMAKTSSSPSPPPQDLTQLRESQPQRHIGSNDPVSYATSGPLSPPLLLSGSGPHVDAPRHIAPPRRTDHTYHDYATHTPSPYDYPVTKKSTSNFPAKLHRMISDPTNSQAIQWQPHGRGTSSDCVHLWGAFLFSSESSNHQQLSSCAYNHSMEGH